MNPLYRPLPNRLARMVLHPLRRVLPAGLKLPVYGPHAVELPGGASIHLDFNPTSYLGKRLYWEGFEGFEPALARIFTVLIQDAQVIVDVGANIGYYSLVTAALVPDAKVYSFEPLPAAYNYLQRNIALNGFTTIRAEDLALSDADGDAVFHVGRKAKYDAIADHLVATSSFDREQARRTGPIEPITVSMTTLDRYATEVIQQRIDVLKLDTEGTEDRVLHGAQRILDEDRPAIFCEVLPGRIEEALEAIFRAHTYRLFRIEESGLVPLDALSTAPGRSNDHLMLPAERAEAYIAAIKAGGQG